MIVMAGALAATCEGQSSNSDCYNFGPGACAWVMNEGAWPFEGQCVTSNTGESCTAPGLPDPEFCMQYNYCSQNPFGTDECSGEPSPLEDAGKAFCASDNGDPGTCPLGGWEADCVAHESTAYAYCSWGEVYACMYSPNACIEAPEMVDVGEPYESAALCANNCNTWLPGNIYACVYNGEGSWACKHQAGGEPSPLEDSSKRFCAKTAGDAGALCSGYDVWRMECYTDNTDSYEFVAAPAACGGTAYFPGQAVYTDYSFERAYEPTTGLDLDTCLTNLQSCPDGGFGYCQYNGMDYTLQCVDQTFVSDTEKAVYSESTQFYSNEADECPDEPWNMQNGGCFQDTFDSNTIHFYQYCDAPNYLFDYQGEGGCVDVTGQTTVVDSYIQGGEDPLAPLSSCIDSCYPMEGGYKGCVYHNLDPTNSYDCYGIEVNDVPAIMHSQVYKDAIGIDALTVNVDFTDEDSDEFSGTITVYEISGSASETLNDGCANTYSPIPNVDQIGMQGDNLYFDNVAGMECGSSTFNGGFYGDTCGNSNPQSFSNPLSLGGSPPANICLRIVDEDDTHNILFNDITVTGYDNNNYLEYNRDQLAQAQAPTPFTNTDITEAGGPGMYSLSKEFSTSALVDGGQYAVVIAINDGVNDAYTHKALYYGDAVQPSLSSPLFSDIDLTNGASQEFSFQITYTDPRNIEPDYVRVEIAGQPAYLTLQMNEGQDYIPYAEGVTYSGSWPYVLPDGTYTYSFIASNGQAAETELTDGGFTFDIEDIAGGEAADVVWASDGGSYLYYYKNAIWNQYGTAIPNAWYLGGGSSLVVSSGMNLYRLDGETLTDITYNLNGDSFGRITNGLGTQYVVNQMNSDIYKLSGTTWDSTGFNAQFFPDYVSDVTADSTMVYVVGFDGEGQTLFASYDGGSWTSRINGRPDSVRKYGTTAAADDTGGVIIQGQHPVGGEYGTAIYNGGWTDLGPNPINDMFSSLAYYGGAWWGVLNGVLYKYDGSWTNMGPAGQTISAITADSELYAGGSETPSALESGSNHICASTAGNICSPYNGEYYGCEFADPKSYEYCSIGEENIVCEMGEGTCTGEYNGESASIYGAPYATLDLCLADCTGPNTGSDLRGCIYEYDSPGSYSCVFYEGGGGSGLPEATRYCQTGAFCPGAVLMTGSGESCESFECSSAFCDIGYEACNIGDSCMQITIGPIVNGCAPESTIQLNGGSFMFGNSFGDLSSCIAGCNILGGATCGEGSWGAECVYDGGESYNCYCIESFGPSFHASVDGVEQGVMHFGYGLETQTIDLGAEGIVTVQHVGTDVGLVDYISLDGTTPSVIDLTTGEDITLLVAAQDGVLADVSEHSLLLGNGRVLTMTASEYDLAEASSEMLFLEGGNYYAGAYDGSWAALTVPSFQPSTMAVAPEPLAQSAEGIEITDIIADVSGNSVTIMWTLDTPGMTGVEYGTVSGAPYEFTEEGYGVDENDFEATIMGLEESEGYFFRIYAYGEGYLYSVSLEDTFTTEEELGCALTDVRAFLTFNNNYPFFNGDSMRVEFTPTMELNDYTVMYSFGSPTYDLLMDPFVECNDGNDPPDIIVDDFICHDKGATAGPENVYYADRLMDHYGNNYFEGQRMYFQVTANMDGCDPVVVEIDTMVPYDSAGILPAVGCGWTCDPGVPRTVFSDGTFSSCDDTGGNDIGELTFAACGAGEMMYTVFYGAESPVGTSCTDCSAYFDVYPLNKGDIYSYTISFDADDLAALGWAVDNTWACWAYIDGAWETDGGGHVTTLAASPTEFSCQVTGVLDPPMGGGGPGATGGGQVYSAPAFGAWDLVVFFALAIIATLAFLVTNPMNTKRRK